VDTPKELYSSSADLHPTHWEKIVGADYRALAANSGFAFDGKVYSHDLLGDQVTIDPEKKTVTYADKEGDVGFSRALVCLAYLGMAMDVPLSGVWTNFSELPGGDAFFKGHHGIKTKKLAECIGDSPERLYRVSTGLGAKKSEGADAAVEMPVLPRVPVKVLVWGRTDEFPAEAKLLTDKRAYLHLHLDALWAVTNLVIEKLTGG
jgi:hypothetical protein